MTASFGDRTCPGDAAEVIKLAGVLAKAKLLPALRTNSWHEQLQMHCWQQAIATQQARPAGSPVMTAHPAGSPVITVAANQLQLQPALTSGS